MCEFGGGRGGGDAPGAKNTREERSPPVSVPGFVVANERLQSTVSLAGRKGREKEGGWEEEKDEGRGEGEGEKLCAPRMRILTCRPPFLFTHSSSSSFHPN